MNAEILKLLLLKNQWVLIHNTHLVYVHEADLQRNGDIVTFSWNKSHLFTRVFNISNIGGVNILNDVKIINPEKVESLFAELVKYSKIEKELTSNVTYCQYDKLNQQRLTKDTKYFELAKCSNETFLMLNDSTMWRMLSLKHGKFRLPLHVNNDSFGDAPESYQWHDGTIDSAAERCIAISLPDGLIEWLKRGAWDYFEAVSESESETGSEKGD